MQALRRRRGQAACGRVEVWRTGARAGKRQAFGNAAPLKMRHKLHGHLSSCVMCFYAACIVHRRSRRGRHARHAGTATRRHALILTRPFSRSHAATHTGPHESTCAHTCAVARRALAAALPKCVLYKVHTAIQLPHINTAVQLYVRAAGSAGGTSTHFSGGTCFGQCTYSSTVVLCTVQ